MYSVASHLNSMFVYLSTAISGVMLPKISKLVATNAKDSEISNEFIKVGRIQYYLIFLMASGLCLFGKDFFIIWAGKEYINSYYISLILILPLCIDLIQNLGISILQSKNLHKSRSILYIIIAFANILISIPLSKFYGGIGAAIGTALSLIIGNGIIMNIYYFKKAKIDIPLFWKEIIKMSMHLFVPLICICVIDYFICLSGIIRILLVGTLYVLLYSFTSYFIVMNEYEKSIVNSFATKFKK